MDPWKILLWLWRSKHNNISQILYPVLLDPCQQKHCATFSKIWNFIVLFAMLCFVTCCCVLTFRATVDSVCWVFFFVCLFFLFFLKVKQILKWALAISEFCLHHHSLYCRTIISSHCSLQVTKSSDKQFIDPAFGSLLSRTWSSQCIFGTDMSNENLFVTFHDTHFVYF